MNLLELPAQARRSPLASAVRAAVEEIEAPLRPAAKPATINEATTAPQSTGAPTGETAGAPISATMTAAPPSGEAAHRAPPHASRPPLPADAGDAPAAVITRLMREVHGDPLARIVYLAHFGMRRAPFSLTPHPDFFYGAGERGNLLHAVFYSLLHGNGIVAITGEVGTGKTMIARMLMACAPSTLEIAFLANPSIRRSEVVPMIADELGIELGAGPSVLALRTLHLALIERYAAGKRVVLLVDEAHAMRPEALEEIRLLSNLESASHKLLQILLVGQDELRDVVSGRAQRPLRERITQWFALAPLSRDEVAAYLRFRCKRAGASTQPFEADAARLIAQGSAGLVRRINILADKALMAAFVEHSPRVRARHVEQALEDAAFQSLRGPSDLLPRIPVRRMLRGLRRIAMGAAARRG